MTTHLTIVGGGIGGLTAAIAAREAGMDVTVLERGKELGGRAGSTDGPFVANWGPHVVYDDGPMWQWLEERKLTAGFGKAPLTRRTAFRWDGRARRLPPVRFGRAALRLREAGPAPAEQPFHDWAARLVGDEMARRLSAGMGVTTFDHDPGRVSAAFLHEQLRRVLQFPPRARYSPGGWVTFARRLADYARAAGARIETGSPVDVLPAPPVVLAVPLAVASDLLGDASLAWPGTRAALLDLGLRSSRRDPFIISDLDEPGWAETFSMADRSLAPSGHRLVQAQKGLRPGETLEDGVARIEAMLDCGFPRWREREVWRRRARVVDETGALDPPGTTWRDRPRVDQGDGVYLVGDMVAARGLLSEVSHASALAAIAALVSHPQSLPSPNR